MQLIAAPSFGEKVAFEIRQAGDDWRLFRSKVLQQHLVFTLLGYDLVKVEPDVLASFFNRTCALTIPLHPLLNRGVGLDGAIFQLSLSGDNYSEWRFQWWSSYPADWQPLVEIFNEMILSFSIALKKTDATNPE